MNAPAKRFRVALSFPGEHRVFVGAVADQLASWLGKQRVLYDRYYEAEFARVDQDVYLQDLYYNQSDLNAVFLCAEYEKKEWCGLEWRALRDLIKTGRGSEILPLRFDETAISGLFSLDTYIWIPGRAPVEVAELILARLQINEEGPSRGRPPAGSRRQRIAPSRLTHVAEDLIGREADLARLDAVWQDPKVHVVTLVAWGGVGKTSLVAAWAGGLAERRFDGAAYFDWSFYSQGTREQGGASADTFVAEALRFFGDPEMAASTASAWDKGARLAQLVAERRSLLVLDGLEPLQYPPGPLAGQLKDPAITAFLKGLAANNAGLCVVTTREKVTDLASFRKSTAPEWELERLSTPAGVQLLKRLGVGGAEADLNKLVEDVGGHALTLNLLGSFLARAHKGDVRKRDQVELQEADNEVQGGHAFKTMAAYERWLAQAGEKGTRQLTILRLLGLFDRPANEGCIAVLRKPPVIPGLTEPLVELPAKDWNLAITALREARLLALSSSASGQAGALAAGEELDAHPLLREHFARRLREQHPEAWRAAHSRLYEHLRDSTERWPADLEGLQPLYQAVAHGCQAGRQQEACDKVYFDRISRGGEAFVVRKLGAFGADLGAVASFFEPPWSRVSPALTEADQAWLLSQAAFRLRALGRLTEALEPMRAGLEMAIQQGVWKDAASVANNLSELELTLGEVAAAVRDAEQSVTFADRIEEWSLRMILRTTQADALHLAGRRAEALELFREAERMQTEQQPEYPLLYSLQGFRYCDQLLEGAERAAWRREAKGTGLEGLTRGAREVEERARTALQIVMSGSQNLLDIARNHLTLGRARLYRAVLEGTDPIFASSEIEGAVKGLRHAGDITHLPKGLLTRAWLRALQSNLFGAQADLDEVQEIAERGPMPLFLADFALYRARLFHDRAALATARRLIEKHGYWRRKEELEDAEEAAKSWPQPAP